MAYNLPIRTILILFFYIHLGLPRSLFVIYLAVKIFWKNSYLLSNSYLDYMSCISQSYRFNQFNKLWERWTMKFLIAKPPILIPFGLKYSDQLRDESLRYAMKKLIICSMRCLTWKGINLYNIQSTVFTEQRRFVRFNTDWMSKMKGTSSNHLIALDDNFY